MTFEAELLRLSAAISRSVRRKILSGEKNGSCRSVPVPELEPGVDRLQAFRAQRGTSVSALLPSRNLLLVLSFIVL